MTSFYAGSTEHEWKIQNHETLEKTDNQVRVNTYEKKKSAANLSQKLLHRNGEKYF